MKSAILILIIVLFGLLAFKGCDYLDLQVSRKYETQWEGISNSPESIANAVSKNTEIEKSEKKLLIEASAIVGALSVLVYIFINRSSKKN